MREASWNDCKGEKTARQVSPDIQRAKSLAETSDDRISLVADITEKNCNFVFEDYYTSILELLQAISFVNGFNVLNHLCLGYYIRDVLKREDMFRIFDDLRYKRNSLTYYGSRMDFNTAKQAINKCKDLIVYLKSVMRTT